MDPTARGRRCRLQAHDQIHRLTRVRPTIEYVADDNEMCRATGPTEFVVDHAALPQDASESVESAVDIRDGNDSFYAVELPLVRRLRLRSMERHGEKDIRQPHAVAVWFHTHHLASEIDRLLRLRSTIKAPSTPAAAQDVALEASPLVDTLVGLAEIGDRPVAGTITDFERRVASLDIAPALVQ